MRLASLADDNSIKLLQFCQLFCRLWKRSLENCPNLSAYLFNFEILCNFWYRVKIATPSQKIFIPPQTKNPRKLTADNRIDIYFYLLLKQCKFT